ncbi:hypothetical protein [Rhodococcus sp. 06-235-1A]|nr:hypothetical protein [Rhodococcus sp. 06-235-1A]
MQPQLVEQGGIRVDGNGVATSGNDAAHELARTGTDVGDGPE